MKRKKHDARRDLVEKDKLLAQTEEALVESMRRFRDLFEQSPIGISLHNNGGELLLVNGAYLKIFGVKTFSDIPQQNLFDLPGLAAKDARKIRAGKVVQYEYTCDLSDVEFKSSRKGQVHMLFSVSPFSSENVDAGYTVQVQDVTEQKKAAEAQRLAQLGRLVSDMVHEVNNPLMIISGRVSLALRKGVKDKSLVKMMEVISGQCVLAQDIIRRLLQYARTGKVKTEPVDIRETLNLIVDLFRHHFAKSGITIKKNIARDVPAVMANDKKLQEVFMNIIRNAADAMPDGGEITVKARREENIVRIDITDTGEGMPAEVMKKIFEPFYTTKKEGTGLGLALCHTIIRQHGGKLKYKSAEGKGTTATITLPVGNK